MYLLCHKTDLLIIIIIPLVNIFSFLFETDIIELLIVSVIIIHKIVLLSLCVDLF